MCDTEATFQTCPKTLRHLWRHACQGELLMQTFDEAVMLSRIHIIAIIVVVDLAPIHCHFRSRRPQAQQPLYQDDHTATGPAHLLSKNLFVAVVVVFSVFWLL